MKKIILIVVAVLVVGIGGFLFFLSGKKEKDYSFNYDPGDYFVTDITGSTRLLKADIVISMADFRKQDFYTENNHRVRDVVIQAFRGKTEAELQSADAQQALSLEIVGDLNSEFGNEDFLRIYFNEFVIQ